MKSNKYFIFLPAFFLLLGCSFEQTIDYRNSSLLCLWFDRPAETWTEALPLGNGRLGLMADGQIDKETIVLNDITLWSGGVQDANNPDAVKYLPEIRKLLFEGKNDKAQELVYRTFVCKGAGSGKGRGAHVPYGSYEVLGNLHIDYRYGNKGKPQEYHRELSLNNAVAHTSFVKDDVKYTREYFADFKRDVMIVRLYASELGKLNFNVGIDRPEAFETVTDGNDLLMKGQLNNGTDGKGMRYNARVRIKLTGAGKLSAVNNKLHVSGAQEAIIFVSAATDYKDPGFETRCLSLLNKADEESKYTSGKALHSVAFREYFDRTSLALKKHTGKKDTMPIDRRLRAFADDPDDNGLVELYFQYGRYLLISSARQGLLPPNLQGLWANTVNTPWNGDYHLNINVQMNHWPAEVTNLSEMHLPLLQLTESLMIPGRETAKAFYGVDGWVAHMMTNIWEFTAPGEHPSWGATNTGGAWLCAHLWEHYDFTRDRQYLQRVYPVLKGAAEFFLNTLVPEPKYGRLVTAPTTSPENTFYMPGTKKEVSVCMGATMDNQLVRELFTNTVAAAQILDLDADLRDRLQQAAAKLPPDSIAPDGYLMEWLEDYEEVDPHHRHVSHLYGLYPGNQITPERTPDLAEAARKTLERRGDRGTGWSRAWKINFWTRLGDGDRAYKLFCNLLAPARDTIISMKRGGGTYPNLFCAHPPFQIDGNFGGCAGIAEMLLQSHSGFIELLPALPEEFSEGSFDRLCVRGGAEVSAAWTERKLTSARLSATADNTIRLKIPDDADQVTFTKAGRPLEIIPVDGIAELTLKKGESVQIMF